MQSISAILRGGIKLSDAQIKQGDYKCVNCLDCGIVMIKEILGGRTYEVAYKCNCRAGSNRREAFPVVDPMLMGGR